jgi:hypothetical protein
MGVKVKQTEVPAATCTVTDETISITLSLNSKGTWTFQDFRELVTVVGGVETQRSRVEQQADAGAPVDGKYPNATGGFLPSNNFTRSQFVNAVPTLKAGAVEIASSSLIPLLLDAMDKMRNVTISDRKEQAVQAAKEAAKEGAPK